MQGGVHECALVHGQVHRLIHKQTVIPHIAVMPLIPQVCPVTLWTCYHSFCLIERSQRSVLKSLNRRIWHLNCRHETYFTKSYVKELAYAIEGLYAYGLVFQYEEDASLNPWTRRRGCEWHSTVNELKSAPLRTAWSREGEKGKAHMKDV